MARHERDFRSDTGAALSLDEFLALLGSGADSDERSREDAIACYLSGSAGWRDALKMLGGTFADGAGLKERKGD